MKVLLLRRPSASMVVALGALIVAASGTAIAASKLVAGDSLVKRNSLSGDRLRSHSVSGTQINLRKLGKVPTARNADHASVAQSSANAVNAQDAQLATNAKNATNAASAFNASNADNLGGQPPSAFLRSSSRIGTNGIVKVAGTASGYTVRLFTVGPFTVAMTCTKTGSGTSVMVSASSREANSVLFGTQVATADTPTDLGNPPDVPQSPGFNESRNNSVDFEAPSGAQALLSAADGVNSLGTDCWANWAGIG
jgi:hypothetical protein